VNVEWLWMYGSESIRLESETATLSPVLVSQTTPDTPRMPAQPRALPRPTVSAVINSTNGPK